MKEIDTEYDVIQHLNHLKSIEACEKVQKDIRVSITEGFCTVNRIDISQVPDTRDHHLLSFLGLHG
jgi:hypothetical protein